MKKGIKYVVVLCMLVAMLVPSVAFASGMADINEICSEKISLYKSLSKSNICFDKQMLKEACTIMGNMKVKTSCTAPVAKLDRPSAPAIPVKPSTNANLSKPYRQVKQEVPAKVEKPSKIEKPVKVEKPVEAEKPVTTPGTDQKPNAQVENSKSQTGSYEAQVADIVNKERAAQGLPALKFNSQLSKVAEAKAADLRDKNYFSHTSPTYGSPFDMMKSFGISYTTAGENIAKGYKTPDAVMKGWMDSAGHKANILNSSFTEIGVGYVTDSSGTGYWVQMFIRP